MPTPLQVKVQKALDTLRDEVSSQDPLDAAAAEYNVAAMIASYAEPRKERAKKNLIDLIQKQVDDVQSRARKFKQKQSGQAQGAERVVVITCNAPASRTDVQQFVNELRKAGVDETTINKALAAAAKESAPATSFAVVHIGDSNGNGK